MNKPIDWRRVEEPGEAIITRIREITEHPANEERNYTQEFYLDPMTGNVYRREGPFWYRGH